MLSGMFPAEPGLVLGAWICNHSGKTASFCCGWGFVLFSLSVHVVFQCRTSRRNKETPGPPGPLCSPSKALTIGYEKCFGP